MSAAGSKEMECLEREILDPIFIASFDPSANAIRVENQPVSFTQNTVIDVILVFIGASGVRTSLLRS